MAMPTPLATSGDMPVTDESTSTKIPARALFIVGNEACERLSFYGMQSILTIYVAQHLGKGDTAGTVVSSLFNSAVYFTPLFGAILADRWLGRYRTILSLSFFYCLGHLTLALCEGSERGLYIGLALIALGAGGIKPCVSAFLGDQLDKKHPKTLTKAYSIFYWAINFGSLFAFIGIPWARHRWGYAWAFGIPGIFMGVALVVFFLGTRTYVKVPPAGRHPGFLTVLRHCLFAADKSVPFWERARGVFDDELVDGSRRTVGVIGLYSVVPIFWALFDQTQSTWVLQGAKLVPILFHVPVIGEWTLDGESMQALNPVLVMLLIPFTMLVLYPLAEKSGLRPSPLRRMTVGMLFIAVSFAICAFIQKGVDAGDHLSILWQAVPYVFLTLGEVMFSTTGLEFAFTQAPKMMRSTLMSFWLLTTAAGDILIALFATGLNDLFNPAGMFLLYTGLMLAVAGVFAFLAKGYTRKHGA